MHVRRRALMALLVEQCMPLGVSDIARLFEPRVDAAQQQTPLVHWHAAHAEHARRLARCGSEFRSLWATANEFIWCIGHVLCVCMNDCYQCVLWIYVTAICMHVDADELARGWLGDD